VKLRKISSDKKGELSMFSLFTWMITAFLAVVMFAGMIWVMGTLNDVFTEVGLENEKNAGQPGYTNMSLATEQIWGTTYESIQALRMVATVYILALAASIIIVGFLERKHPFLFFVYMLVVLLGLIFSPTISNAYEELLVAGLFEGELETFVASNFILLNLPVFVLVIGGLGGIGLFINLVRNGNEGELR